MDLSISSGAPPASPPGPARPAAPGLLRGVLPHLVWEAILLLIVVAFAIALAVKNSDVFTRGGMWSQLASTGMFAAALALSFRTATPNLAVTTIGMASGWWYAGLVNDGTSAVVAWLVAVVAAAAIGLVLAVLVGLTPLPAWAVSLVGTLLVTGVVRIGDGGGATRVIRGGEAAGDGTFIAWLVVVALGSVAGGVLFAVPRIRVALSRNRPEPGAEPPPLGAKLVGALVGLGGSSLLAGIAGVLFTLRLHAASPIDFAQGTVLVVVLVAGVSMLGRRGGIFGVVLAVALVVFVQTLLVLNSASSGVQLLVLGVVGLFGLAVVAVLEWLGRLLERPRAGPGAPPPAPVYGPGQPFAPTHPFAAAQPPAPGQPPVPGQPPATFAPGQTFAAGQTPEPPPAP